MFTAKIAKEFSDKSNQEYEDNCKHFLNLKKEDIEDFKKFILNEIEKNATIGCSCLEFELNNDLIKTNGIIDFFTSLGYKVNFYKLNREYSNANYCLSINWL